MRQLDSRGAGVHGTFATGKHVEMERYYFFYLSNIFYYWLGCGDGKMRHLGTYYSSAHVVYIISADDWDLEMKICDSTIVRAHARYIF